MLLIPDDIFAIVTIWQEARGEIHIGKVAVGEVIRNRMKMRYHSDGTAAGTVLQPRQFSGWNEGNYNRIISVKQDAQDPAMMDCARAWLESETTSYSKGAVLFEGSRFKTPVWANDPGVVFTVEIGNQKFYKVEKK